MRYLLLLTLAACGGNLETPEPHDAAPDVNDAEQDAGPDADHPHCGPCCGTDHRPPICDEAGVDAPREAAPEAGGLLCCSTGQNLLVCDPSAPWSCPVSPTHVTTCTSTECVVGSPCQGFNGTGTVVICGTGPMP